MAGWFLVLGAVGSPLLAFAGAYLGHRGARRPTTGSTGGGATSVVILDALLDTELLQGEDVPSVRCVATSVVLSRRSYIDPDDVLRSPAEASHG